MDTPLSKQDGFPEALLQLDAKQPDYQTCLRIINLQSAQSGLEELPGVHPEAEIA